MSPFSVRFHSLQKLSCCDDRLLCQCAGNSCAAAVFINFLVTLVIFTLREEDNCMRKTRSVKGIAKHESRQIRGAEAQRVSCELHSAMSRYQATTFSTLRTLTMPHRLSSPAGMYPAAIICGFEFMFLLAICKQ
jgi:hypothetical protein